MLTVQLARMPSRKIKIVTFLPHQNENFQKYEMTRKFFKISFFNETNDNSIQILYIKFRFYFYLISFLVGVDQNCYEYIN